jgi:hypothetical protein
MALVEMSVALEHRDAVLGGHGRDGGVSERSTGDNEQATSAVLDAVPEVRGEVAAVSSRR